MRVNLHDFSGHPFQAQLSRYLAGQGHEVVHTYSSQYVTGHGRLTVQPDDPRTLRFVGLTAEAPMIKYSPLGRARFELSYAAAWSAFLADEGRFDLVVACNVPLFTLSRMRRQFARDGQRWALWHQDIYSLGVAAEAERVLPRSLSGLVRRRLERMEATQVADAGAVVAIGEAFVRKYAEWGISPAALVVPNWAPLDELVPRPRDNDWAREQKLASEPLLLLYAGTLGRKHNPRLLLDLLDSCRSRAIDAMLVVVSEGVGADEIRALAGDRTDVQVLGYQPAEQFPDVLGSADVLLALLEPDAAQYSVPSKVLSYLSAGRCVVAMMPRDNPAAEDIRSAGGFVAEPTATGARLAGDWVAQVAADPLGFAARGERSRKLAEERFCIDYIGKRFEEIFLTASGELPAVDGSVVVGRIQPAISGAMNFGKVISRATGAREVASPTA